MDARGVTPSGSQTVELELAPADPAPGDLVDVQPGRSRLRESVLGLYLEVDEGDLTPLPGAGSHAERQRSYPPWGSTCRSAATWGEARFRWQVPDRPGASRFLVSTVVGNGNGPEQRETRPRTTKSSTWYTGAPPRRSTPTVMKTGFGVDDEPRLFCEGSSPELHTLQPGDCNDFNDEIFPGGNDVCNQRDDDCDGTSRTREPRTSDLYPDGDRDGYYSRRRTRERGDNAGLPRGGKPVGGQSGGLRAF